MIDLKRARTETPGCAHRIHLNNAGAALMPQPVLNAILEHLQLESEIGGYEARAERAGEIEAAYGSIARLLGTEPYNVAFMENATAAFNQALSSIPFEPGDIILTTLNDYASNQIAYLSLERRIGVQVVRAPDRSEGGVDPMAMEEMIHRLGPKVVAVTHVPTNSGLVQPVSDIGEICKRKNVLYLVDACQSVGQVSIDVMKIGCDFLSATARKYLRGPRGMGFLYVSDRALELGLEPLLPDMRGADWIGADLYQPAPDARRFENWEFPYSLVLGAARAADYAMNVGLDEIRDSVYTLARSLRDRLEKLPNVDVLDFGDELCGIVTISVEGWRPEDLVSRLRDQNINTSASPREAAVIDYDAKGVQGALRISPHYYNTEEELDQVAVALTALAE